MILVTLSPTEVAIVRRNAQLAELGGASCIRSVDRLATLAGDQYTAQAGEVALSLYMTGSIRLYEATRELRNERPWQGDSGADLLDTFVDVKTSRMRRGSTFNYHLWVRPREYQPDTCYILALMYASIDDIVHLVGWKQGKELAFHNDRYSALASDLHPLAYPFEPGIAPESFYPNVDAVSSLSTFCPQLIR